MPCHSIAAWKQETAPKVEVIYTILPSVYSPLPQSLWIPPPTPLPVPVPVSVPLPLPHSSVRSQDDAHPRPHVPVLSLLQRRLGFGGCREGATRANASARSQEKELSAASPSPGPFPSPPASSSLQPL
ncbi:hypothetical protein BDA96_10G292900 [Sorghum bicolor]|uniref:Uncharacterized protein n=1 Tax=Sorghum bicolor TaxID=4558 RepID=A0A921U2G8_SORBI|nr:hypothetical protein BDA96_10G292900 [Sorghum bicolor]